VGSCQDESGRPLGVAGGTTPPPHSETASWVDWVGSRQCHELDEATRAFVHSAFAAGFEAGWRQHLLSLKHDQPSSGAA
jgi:hypothetical protein